MQIKGYAINRHISMENEHRNNKYNAFLSFFVLILFGIICFVLFFGACTFTFVVLYFSICHYYSNIYGMPNVHVYAKWLSQILRISTRQKHSSMEETHKI